VSNERVNGNRAFDSAESERADWGVSPTTQFSDGGSRRLAEARVTGEAVSVTSLTGLTEADLVALIAEKEMCLRAVDPHHQLLSANRGSPVVDWLAAA
jgi:hypothetical protein